MTELAYIILAVIAYGTAYIVSLYSLAVYIDPDEVEVLFPQMSRSRKGFLKKLAGDPRAFVQVAIIYRSLALVVITVAAYRMFSTYLVFNGVPHWLLPAVGLGVVWILFVVTVEYLPRRSSRTAINQRMSRHLWVISVIYFFFYPFVRLFRSLLRKVNSGDMITEEEKEEIVERAIETLADQAGINEAIVEEEEKEMIGQIFQLDQTLVKEIMVPRINVTAIEHSLSFNEIRRLVLQDGHSRYPVFRDSIDNVIGMIYVKDLFTNLPERGETFEVSKYLREPYFVPETKVIGELLSEFKTKRLHIAVVVDEFGGVSGIVTLEDIIEEIFGEIQDEHDWEQENISVMSDGSYVVTAGMLVEDLQEKLETDYEQGDYDTVGGLIYDLVGSVPKEGQKIRWHDIEFEIQQIEGQRIATVTVRR